MKKVILILILVILYLSSFPPRNQKIFKQNSLRLLNKSQYSFLTEYFSNYYPKFYKSKDFSYIEKIIRKIPSARQKEKIIITYLNKAKYPNRKIYYLYGQLLLYNEKPSQAVKQFKKYRGNFKNFYLALALKNSGNLIDAETLFLKSLTKNKTLNQQIYILLTEIYLKWNEKRKAKKIIKKITNQKMKKTFNKLAS